MLMSVTGYYIIGILYNPVLSFCELMSLFKVWRNMSHDFVRWSIILEADQ